LLGPPLPHGEPVDMLAAMQLLALEIAARSCSRSKCAAMAPRCGTQSPSSPPATGSRLSLPSFASRPVPWVDAK